MKSRAEGRKQGRKAATFLFFILARKFRRLRAFFVLDCPCEETGNQFYARKKMGKDREGKKKEGKEGKGREGTGWDGMGREWKERKSGRTE